MSHQQAIVKERNNKKQNKYKQSKKKKQKQQNKSKTKIIFTFAPPSQIENISIVSSYLTKVKETKNTTNRGGSRQQNSNLLTRI